MKRIISIILTLALLIGCIPMNTFAADSGEICAVSTYSENASLLEIKKNKAPLRTGPGEKYSTLVKCEKGVVLEKTGTTYNKYLNKWYEVTYQDAKNGKCYTGYMYSENVKKHSHSFDKFEYDGVTYKFCDCGKITITIKTTSTVKKSNALAIAGTAAGSMTLVDGPIPIGDLLGLGIVISVGIMAETGVLPTTTEVQDVLEDIDYNTYYKYKNDDTCPVDSYYRVKRVDGTLKYTDKECIDAALAYVWVVSGKDVWCKDWDTAAKVAALHKDGGFSEIDSGNKDYWYHFHLGRCSETGKHLDVVGGHVFYGTSAITHRKPN